MKTGEVVGYNENALSQAGEGYLIHPSSWRNAETIYVKLLNEGTDVWGPSTHYS